MEHTCVVTISRQYGSGGRYIGSLLARRMGVPFYDKEIINLTAQRGGFSAQALERLDEQAASGLYYSGTREGLLGMKFQSPEDKIFLTEVQIIREAAARGPCVIIGRCADFILRGHGDAVNVFIHAPLKDRIARAVRYYGLDEETAERTILKTDKRRAGYHERYTDTRWGDASNYHLCLDSGAVGVENAAELCAAFVSLRGA